MALHTACLLIFTSVCFSNYCVGEYVVSDIKFEAFEPRGLRVSIPAEKGVELFAFHGKKNQKILQIEPGEFSGDVTKPQNGRFTYYSPDVKLKVGDVIHFWVFVQHDLLGYRRDDQMWTVEKLLPLSDIKKSPVDTCNTTISKVEGKKAICSGDAIIDYKFTGSSLHPDVWIIEQYFPHAPDHEFVIYKNEPDVIGVDNNGLRIQPKVVAENINKSVNIEGCTHPDTQGACNQEFRGLYHPPIVSGQIVSKVAFRFGEITVKAKIPRGDWIFPQIYLQDVNDPKRRILLAYARGNEDLQDKEKNEIGGRLLYGGPYASPYESTRYNHLAKKQLTEHIGADWHVFRVRWTKDQMDLYIDNQSYDFIDASALQSTGFNQETMVHLVLGVGVGGVNDFPDNSTSGSYTKPWKNRGSRNLNKDFFNGRDLWENTWKADNKLLVEYVTVKAI